MINNELWKKCAEHHGHECPGLTIGYRAALYAAELLGIEPCPESGAVCLAGSNKCPTDAMRAVFGCTEENGRLSFDLTGEQVFTVTAPSGKAVRLALKNVGEDLTRDEKFKLFHEIPAQDMFDVTVV